MVFRPNCIGYEANKRPAPGDHAKQDLNRQVLWAQKLYGEIRYNLLHNWISLFSRYFILFMSLLVTKVSIYKVGRDAPRNFFCCAALHYIIWEIEILGTRIFKSLSHRDHTKVTSISISPMTSYQGRYFHFYSGPPCIYSPWLVPESSINVRVAFTELSTGQIVAVKLGFWLQIWGISLQMWQRVLRTI